MKNIQLGFIALFRQFLDWEWFTDINTCHLFVYCLLRANHTDKAWRGIKIKKGQFITSFRTMSQETGLSVQEVRTALNKLLSTQELTHEPHRQNSIITVNNYSIYQNSNTRFNKRATTDNNKIIDSNTSYINSSSSSIEDLPKISEEEEELLKNHSKKNKVKYFKPWLRKILENGDYKEILEKERLKQAKNQEEQKKEKEKSKMPIITDEEMEKAKEEALSKISEESRKQLEIRRRKNERTN